LGDAEAVVMLDETAELKKATGRLGWAGTMRGTPGRWTIVDR
jgi:hypothetical protein